MTIRAALAALAAVSIGGCAGTDSHLRLLEKDNAVRVEPAATPDATYVVSVRNVFDVGYDPDDKATRDDVALRMVRAQCPGGQVVGETMIATGEYLLGRQARTYAIKVRCEVAARQAQR